MANPITFLGSPAAITLTDDGTWRTYSLTGLGVPTGASGVLLRSRFSAATSNDNFAVRKTGSTDNYVAAHIASPSYAYTLCGVDASAQIDIQIEDGGAGAGSVEVLGYFDSGSVKFFTNCITQAAPATTWTDWDISASTGGDTAIAAILYLHSARTNPTDVGWRKNGSSEALLKSHTGFTGGRYIGCVIVPVDSSEILEIYNASTAYGDFKCIGYVTANYVTIDPGDDVSLGATGAWTDITQTGALAQMIDAHTATDGQSLGFRKNGDSSTTGYGILEANVGVTARLPALIECDASGVIEMQIDNTGVDAYRRGYFTAEAAVALLTPMTFQPMRTTLRM